MTAGSGAEGQHLVCPQQGRPLLGCLSEDSCCSHVWPPRANAGPMHCSGNNNVSGSIMSYFIKCRVAKVLEQLLRLCRMLNTQSDHLFSIWGKTCPLILNTLKLLLACVKQHEGAFTFQHFILQWLSLFAKIVQLRNLCEISLHL